MSAIFVANGGKADIGWIGRNDANDPERTSALLKYVLACSTCIDAKFSVPLRVLRLRGP
jgi:hypothetical protein